MNNTLKQRLRERRKRMGDTGEDTLNETAGTTMDSTEPYDTTQDMPSDEDIEEAENLKKDLSEKHKEKKRELARQFRSRSREDLRGELKSAKAKSKAKLESSMRQAEEASLQAGPAGEETEEKRRKPREKKKKEKDRVSLASPTEEDDGTVPMSADEDEEAEGKRRRPKVKKKKEKEVDEEADEEAAEVISPEEDAALRKGRRSTVTGKPRGKSLAASIREKMLAKRAAAAMEEKEREEAEEREAEDHPMRKFRGLRDSTMGTRFDGDATMDLMSARLSTQEEETFRLRSARKEKQLTFEELRENIAKRAVTEEEAFDFFTRAYEPEPEPEPQPQSRPEEAEDGGRPAEEEPGTDDQEPLTGSKAELQPLMSQRFKSTMDFVGVGAADYVSHEERVQKEADLLYTPAVVELTPEQKIEVEPRFIEEEGLYVGQKPMIAARNKRRLESRLLKEGSKGWFGEDGEVAMLPDPLKEIPHRPLLWDDQDNPMPTELRTVYVNPFPMELTTRLDPAQGQRWQLEIDVHSVVFSHHHLFSREHVLVQRLRDLMQGYEQAMQQDNVDYCARRILALKRAIGHLEDQIADHKINKGHTDIVTELEIRLKQYRLEIRKTRKTKLMEEGHIRSLSTSIEETWKQIKRVRAETGYTNTEVKMKFHKQTFDAEAEESAQREELEEEVLEERVMREEMYNKERLAYEEQLAQFEAQAERKKNAQAREDRRQRPKDQGEDPQSLEDENDEQQEAEDMKTLAEIDLDRPTTPVPFDEEETRQRILTEYRKHRRAPGKSRLVPTLVDGATLTPDSQCQTGERQRRNAMSRYRYFVKVLFNHKEVCCTEIKDLGSDFTVTYSTLLPVQIVQYPEIIHLQLFEKAGFSSVQLAEVYVPSPDRQTVSGRARVHGYEFSSLHATTHPNAGVGSGVSFRLEAEGDQMTHLTTSGRLYAAAAWAVDENNQPLAPVMPESDNVFSELKSGGDAVTSLGASSIDDMNKLLEFLAEANLDPNDPSDAKLLQLFPVSPADLLRKGGQVHAPEYFRLDHLQEEFNFAEENEITSSNRYRLIMYRDQERPEFRNMRVPATEKEVPPDIFKEYQDKRKRKREQVRGFEARKQQHEEYMQRIRDEVMQRFRQAMHQKSLKEVVIEEEIPAVTAIIPTLMKLGEIQRPLRPIREERKKIPAQNLSQMKVDVIVNIASALNVPTRAEEAGVVAPFVEIVFQEVTRRTHVLDGPNPSWNTEFVFPFRPPPDAESLDTVPDIVDINLYDQVVCDVLEDDRERGSSVHTRIDRHWLGSISIPIATIYLNSKVDGKFAMLSPPHILGYVLPPGETEEKHGATMLSFFVTLEPAIQPPQPLKERFESGEEEALLTHAEHWTKELDKAFPNRLRKTTVVDMHCHEVFITRYLAPLNPPQEILDMASERSEQQIFIARYVSLVPFLADANVCPGMCDIWSSCDQFLKMLAGDVEEHAVLLCNYFLHLFGEGGQVFLCLGNAMPDGPTSYVLTLQEGSSFLWDSALGQRFSTSDVNCPMHSIGCLINRDNMWANVQGKDQPWEMRFDVSNGRDWRPIFGGKFKCPQLSSVQPSKLTYFAPDQREIDSLKFQIDSTLREKFMTWRKGQITKWHYEFMRDLGEVLENLEKHGGRTYKGLEKRFEKYNSRYHLFGFPINLPYTEIDRLVHLVQSTGVHLTTARRVDFAIAVYVKGYANAVVSIWVYVASLVNKRQT